MKTQAKGILRVGTSGIAVPGGKQTFPIEYQLKSRLHYYASLFNTLEVNNTFKKNPLQSTLIKWSDDVPEQFQFTIKLSSKITHVKKLNFAVEDLVDFFRVIQALDIRKRGCLLVQFPGSITIDYFAVVERLLEELSDLDEKNEWQKAIEFRSPTWYIKETDELLEQHKSTMVLHDMPKSKNLVVNKQLPFGYFRYHGPTGNYRGHYDFGFLKEQAESMNSYLNNGKDVYAYFNNTMGNAFENARTLMGLVRS